MADSVLVRFDDDVALAMRERAGGGKQRSINRFVNDAVRAYLDQIQADEEKQQVRDEWGRERLFRFAARLADVRETLEVTQDAGGDENLRAAIQALADCVELIPVPIEKLDPVTWEQFKYSQLNKSGSDQIARDMFARDWAEVEERDWQWYRSHYPTDDEAKFAWFKQRRRYGVPVPPRK